jgi:copper chaperone CopZ
MKKFIMAVICTALYIVNPSAALASNKFNSPKDSTISSDTIVFSATNMSCATDSKMVEKALYRKKGVKKVFINQDQITVYFNPSKVKAIELQNAIENTGSCEDPTAKIHQVEIKTQ